jgi:protein ImuB
LYACLFAYSGESSLVELARQFSPVLEQIDERTVAFSIAGLGRLFGDAHSIAVAISQAGQRMAIAASLAIACNLEASILAARNVRGVTIIPAGDEARALASISVEALPAAPETLATLRRWGVRTVGELAELPEAGLTERLGDAGRRLWRLARGQDTRILDTAPPREEYCARQVLDHPVELLEPLLFVISAQLYKLTRRLEHQGSSASRITVELELEEGTLFVRTLELPLALRDPKALLKQVQLSLEAEPPQGAMVAVRVTLDPTRPRVAQGGLFLATGPEPEKMETLLARLRALVGAGHVGSPEILNTHRPDAYALRPCSFAPAEAASPAQQPLRLAFRYFRPPVAARVLLDQGRPRRIDSAQVSGSVKQAAGPWRTSGEWWAATAWNRDEWDVVLEGHSTYRLYVVSQRWFVDGCYD